MKTFIIMQGWPGSGKSTKAKFLAEKFNAVILSTDNKHFIDGKYVFQPEKLGHFHKLTFEECVAHFKQGSNVVLDNTNIRRKDVIKYIEEARNLGYYIIICRCSGNYRNTHNVPDEKVEMMKKNMQDYKDLADLVCEG